MHISVPWRTRPQPSIHTATASSTSALSSAGAGHQASWLAGARWVSTPSLDLQTELENRSETWRWIRTLPACSTTRSASSTSALLVVIGRCFSRSGGRDL